MQVRQGPQDLLVLVEPLGRRDRRGCRVNQVLRAYRVHLCLLAPKALLEQISSPSRWNPPATSPLVQRTTTSCFLPMASP